MVNYFKQLIFILVIPLIFSCGNSSENNNSDDFSVPDSVLNEDDPLIVSEQAMADIISNISSPVEMSALIKESGVQFNYKYLNPTDNIDSYNTTFKQALNLGILGADLGYLNMYNKTGTVLSYITSIKTLADNIKVGQFFDFSTLKRLATNSDNLDSLMYISVSSFDQMDVFLRENNRSDVSTLIVTGVWIEGLFLATQVVKDAPNKEIEERIGEQKLILSDLLLILNNYKRDKKIFDLIEMINKIKEQYANVTISYEVGEPEAVEVDGVLTIIQNEKSIVNITQDQIKSITKEVENVRNFIVK
jgi:hypothetical protein